MRWRLLRIYPDLFNYFFPPEAAFRDPKIRQDVSRWFWRTFVLLCLTFISLAWMSYWVWEPLLALASFSCGCFIRLGREAMRQMKDL